MNWKFLLFVTAALSGVKAESCPATDSQGCPNGANTNFVFDGYTNTWLWVSSTIQGVYIYDTGLITFNPQYGAQSVDIDHICIQWKDGSYTYVSRPSDGPYCDLEPFTKSISNAWGYFYSESPSTHIWHNLLRPFGEGFLLRFWCPPMWFLYSILKFWYCIPAK
jgi:hypothetical protein